MGGEPARPCSTRSQPTAARTCCRAAARHVKWAVWQPVTNAKDALSGIASRSLTQAPAVFSATSDEGPSDSRPRFWSQADTRMSAASAAGSDEPTTKPK